jgi:hypothetical protein
MAAGSKDNGNLNNSSRVGFHTRSITDNIPYPSVTQSWDGTNPIVVHRGSFAVSSALSANLYARLTIRGVRSGYSSLLSKGNGSTAIPPVVNWNLSETKYTSGSFTATIEVYTNTSGGRPDNSFPTADDTRMGEKSATDGDYWARISYYSVPDSPINVAAGGTNSANPVITFTDSTETGGKSVSSRRVVWNTTDNFTSSSSSWLGSTTPFTSGSTVSGSFASNTVFYFRVITTNAVGDSPYSASASWYYRILSFNTNGGGAAPSTLYPVKGAAVTLPSAPSRTGFSFLGWNTAANGSGTRYAAGASYTAPANTTLYAEWLALTPFIHNGTSMTRSSLKISNGSAMVPGQIQVYKGPSIGWGPPS